ncbi:sugar phosphate isomerase/epimerase family protein [Metabacillus endolithicus]|uniref:Sugar phosphate isomerase/epimerase family protein n=1 Tax=Metabacillus endolithicus TaxID=1535204 RepID=A0ABW5C020_9BACI|nr:TIM barrel protein [Metabacillus endolithicus]UPG62631.1 sugar phosphate isomerase/epimerase [Metabacillus endolithicus]
MNSIKTAVSLYSFQDEYARGKMSLEDCIKELSQQGVEGVELISDQMLHNAPFVSDQDIESWKKLTQKYNVFPACNDIFINTKLYRNRILTQKENLQLLKDELILANKLGFKLVRLVSLTPTDIIENALPLAEELDVIMALEIHGGMGLDHPETKKFTDIMFKVNSPYLGLVVDTGIFCRKHPRVSTQFFLQQGLNKELADYIDNEFAMGRDVFHISHPGTAPAEVQTMIKNKIDQEYLIFAGGYENKPFSDLDKILPYIKHFHGKFWDMTEEGLEYSIPYDEFIDYLKENNYNGYIASEYEGGRFALPGSEIDAISQVRAHQAMLRKYIG